MNTLLRKVPQERWGDDMTARILEVAREAGSRVTVIEGLVTHTVHIVFHNGRKPRRKLLEQYAAEELAAVVTEGGMQ